MPQEPAIRTGWPCSGGGGVGRRSGAGLQVAVEELEDELGALDAVLGAAAAGELVVLAGEAVVLDLPTHHAQRDPELVGLLDRAADVLLTVDDEERIYVAMPAASSQRADPYAGNILRFNADGTVPRDSHAASPVFARGFSEPANLGWYGRELLATGTSDEWPQSAARLKLDLPATSWPQSLDPVSLGLPTKLRTGAIAVGNTDAKLWLRAFIDASQRLFRLAQNPVAQTPTFEEISLRGGAIPIAVAMGFDGRLLVIVRSTAGASSLLEFRPTCYPASLSAC